jgi:catechol 2,3-dioxygenase-like lactoylglutathione lyase family enzyme
MTKELDTLLGRYDAGQLSRRELLAALAVLVLPGQSPRTAPPIGVAKLLNHVTLYVRDVERSRAFYQSLFGMPVLTQQAPGVNLSVGAGFVGLYPVPTGESPRIDHFCLGLERFDAEATKRRLAAQGIDATLRERDDTKELYLADRDGLRVQLQDVRYNGGVGPLGDRKPA